MFAQIIESMVIQQTSQMMPITIQIGYRKIMFLKATIVKMVTRK